MPDIYSVPKNIDITALKTEGPELALLRSKAVGEPPFMYGIGAYFALVKAIRAFNSSYKLDFDNEIKPMDQVFEDNGIKVVTDLKSFLYLVNTELDFSDGLNGKGFYFNNPNASRSCGCGESFAV